MDDYRFKEIGVNFSVYKNMHACFSEKLGKSVFLIRIGRHSGAESMTIYGHRNIKIMQGQGVRDKHQDYATTLWLASESSKPTSNDGLIPFGWAMLEFEPFDSIPLEPAVAYQGKSKVNGLRTDRNIPTSQTFPDITNDVAPASTPKEPKIILWKKVTLSWRPNDQTLLAISEGRKAEIKIGNDKSFVPEQFHKKLFKDRKSVNTDITVIPLGNAFRIVAFED
jgi:CRISPR-associated protein Csm5